MAAVVNSFDIDAGRPGCLGAGGPHLDGLETAAVNLSDGTSCVLPARISASNHSTALAAPLADTGHHVGLVVFFYSLSPSWMGMAFLGDGGRQVPPFWAEVEFYSYGHGSWLSLHGG